MVRNGLTRDLKLDISDAIIDDITSTAEVPISSGPFERIIGQKHAVAVVRSAVEQRRHVLLCGPPGTGKSLIAKEAYTLLPEPQEQILVSHNPSQPNRPRVVVWKRGQCREEEPEGIPNTVYVRPDDLPFDIGVRMGYRCSKCGSYSLPSQYVCMECESPKRCDWTAEGAEEYASFSGLFRTLDVMKEPALRSVTRREEIEGTLHTITYDRIGEDTIKVVCRRSDGMGPIVSRNQEYPDLVLVSQNSSRFIRVSGASPVELLGDVKHDPYGNTEPLGTAPYSKVVPGAIHEAHEGILYIDEISALGTHQKHLLTAMQDGFYPIVGHNPSSSGAAVRVDDVPCDFILFAACNLEDVLKILPPLRSRIRGYGYEVMLNSWMERTTENANALVRFMTQTVVEDGKIPHLAAEAAEKVLQAAKSMAQRFDGERNAFTLRLRELGGLVRIAGDLAVQERAELVLPDHVERAETLSRGIEMDGSQVPSTTRGQLSSKNYGDYFF
ncbi:MAG: ATP-binding protein [Candidatus Hermodarchaeota archaeon]